MDMVWNICTLMRPPDSASIFFAQGARARAGMVAVEGRNWCRRSVTVCWARALPARVVAANAARATTALRRLRNVMERFLSMREKKTFGGPAGGAPGHVPRQTQGSYCAVKA